MRRLGENNKSSKHFGEKYEWKKVTSETCSYNESPSSSSKKCAFVWNCKDIKYEIKILDCCRVKRGIKESGAAAGGDSFVVPKQSAKSAARFVENMEP